MTNTFNAMDRLQGEWYWSRETGDRYRVRAGCVVRVCHDTKTWHDVDTLPEDARPTVVHLADLIAER